MHTTRLLESINERLGGGKGENVPALGTEWIDDLVEMGLPTDGIGVS